MYVFLSCQFFSSFICTFKNGSKFKYIYLTKCCCFINNGVTYVTGRNLGEINQFISLFCKDPSSEEITMKICQGLELQMRLEDETLMLYINDVCLTCEEFKEFFQNYGETFKFLMDEKYLALQYSTCIKLLCQIFFSESHSRSLNDARACCHKQEPNSWHWYAEFSKDEKLEAIPFTLRYLDYDKFMLAYDILFGKQKRLTHRELMEHLSKWVAKYTQDITFGIDEDFERYNDFENSILRVIKLVNKKPCIW